jgi:hypothetical protein
MRRRNLRRTGTWLLVVAVFGACGGDGDKTSTTARDLPAESTSTSVAGATTRTSATASTTTAPSEGETSLEAPLEVGRAISVANWRIRVVSVTSDGTDQVMTENEFNDPPGEGEQFFIANLEATYVGEESSTFWLDMSLKSVGESNVAYEAFEATCGVIPDDINDSGETFPGGTITGNVCWRISSDDATSLVMIAEESFSFEGSRQFLSLDPAATPLEDSTSTGAEAGGVTGAVPIGQAAPVGIWEVRVLAVTPDGTDAVLSENQFNEPPGEGEQFFIANLEATYIGEESSTFWLDMSLKAVGQSNVAYEAFVAGCGVIPEDVNDSGETFPGGTVSGNVCWKITSDDATSLVMIAEESFGLEETREFFALTG